jgi:hypothetical protein
MESDKNWCVWEVHGRQAKTVAYPGIFSGGGVQKIQLPTEGSENGDLGGGSPLIRVPLNLQMSKTRILIRLLQTYIPHNWEFGSAF